MAGSDYVSLNSVRVDPWSSDSSQNNCWWNIAKNQLGEGATAAEIQALVTEMQHWNEDKGGVATRKNDVLYEEEAVLIPLDYAIDEIQKNVDDYEKTYDDATSELADALKKFTVYNNTVSEAYSAYQQAAVTYENVEANCYDDDGNVISNYAIASLESVAADLEEAQQAYLDALQEQAAAQKDYNEAYEAAQNAEANLVAAQVELAGLLEEYQEEEDVSAEELEALEAELAEIEQALTDTEQELANAKAAYDTANNQQDAAELLGVDVDENGEYSIDSVDTQRLIHGGCDGDNAIIEAENTGDAKTVSEDGVQITTEGDVTTKTVAYDDGTTATFVLQEDGTWAQVDDTDETDTETDEAEGADNPPELDKSSEDSVAAYTDYYSEKLAAASDGDDIIQILADIDDSMLAEIIDNSDDKYAILMSLYGSVTDPEYTYTDSEGNEVSNYDSAMQSMCAYLAYTSADNIEYVVANINSNDETGTSMTNVALEYMNYLSEYTDDGIRNSLLCEVSEATAKEIVNSYVSAYGSADETGQAEIAALLANDIYMAMKGDGCNDAAISAIYDGYNQGDTNRTALLKAMETAFNDIAATDGGHGKWKSTLYKYMIDQGGETAGLAEQLAEDGFFENLNENVNYNTEYSTNDNGYLEMEIESPYWE